MRRQNNHQSNKEKKRNNFKQFNKLDNRSNNRLDRNKYNRENIKDTNKKDTIGIVEKKEYEDLIVGKNAVIELLKTDREINKVWIQKGLRGFEKIYDTLRERQIIISFVDKEKLNRLAENHMGIIASVAPFDYVTIDEILEYAKEKNEKPFILVLDKIQDTHNLGAIIRTAVCSGVHGIIIPKRNAASVNATVVKVSAGATAHIKMARVNNLNYAIDELKEKGLWTISTDINAKTIYYDQDYDMPIALIIGNEEKGVSDLTNKNADFSIKIPMVGDFDSLNASVSTGILCFEILKQRNMKA